MATPKIKGKAAPVRFENVTKAFGRDVIAVDDVNFEVEAGKLVTLLGPSGCGKTTTLRMIAGLEMATSGRILIGDKDDWTPAERCRELQGAGFAQPGLVEAVYYPNAYHSFDSRSPDRTVSGTGGKSHHLAYDPVAAPDAEARTKAFFDRHLR